MRQVRQLLTNASKVQRFEATCLSFAIRKVYWVPNTKHKLTALKENKKTFSQQIKY